MLFYHIKHIDIKMTFCDHFKFIRNFKYICIIQCLNLATKYDWPLTHD